MNDETNDEDLGDVGDDWAAALAEQADQEAEVEAEAAVPNELMPTGMADVDEDSNLEVILDIPVTISMEIGRTKISIRNLRERISRMVVDVAVSAGNQHQHLRTIVSH